MRRWTRTCEVGRKSRTAAAAAPDLYSNLKSYHTRVVAADGTDQLIQFDSFNAGEIRQTFVSPKNYHIYTRLHNYAVHIGLIGVFAKVFFTHIKTVWIKRTTHKRILIIITLYIFSIKVDSNHSECWSFVCFVCSPLKQYNWQWGWIHLVVCAFLFLKI